MSASRRYYLHGDQQAQGAFYCKRCDVFVPASHFADGSHGMSDTDHLRLLAASAASWFGADTKFTRPRYANNVVLGVGYRIGGNDCSQSARGGR